MIKIFNKITAIDIYGSIYEWDAKDFKNKMNSINAEEDITIHINSNGGDVFAGIAIHNIIKKHKGKTTVIIDGLAASAASIIAMGADEIHMPKNAMLMIHNAWTFAAGNSKELRKIADDMDKINESIVMSYVDKTGKSKEDIQALLEAETWLTATEALEAGFCTLVVDEIIEVDEEILNSAKSMYKCEVKPEEPIENVEPIVEEEVIEEPIVEDIQGNSFLANFLKTIQ